MVIAPIGGIEFSAETDAQVAQRNNMCASAICYFPGSITEYVAFRGYEVEVINTDRSDKGVFISELYDQAIVNPTKKPEMTSKLLAKRVFMEKLLGAGIEALVNVTHIVNDIDLGTFEKYGLPVRRKKSS